MGVSIYSPNYSISLGHARFAKLREKIAYQFSEEIGNHYSRLTPWISFEKYNKETKELEAKYRRVCGESVSDLFGFLYASDTKGILSVRACETILGIAEKIPDQDEIIGYLSASGNAPKMSDFEKCLQDCINTHEPLRWF